MELHITVKRERISVTQGFAEVYVNGVKAISCGDDIELIREGDKWYGPMIGGWASITPDEAFIKALLYHPFDDVYHYSEIVKRMLEKPIEEANEQKRIIKNRRRFL